MNETTLLEYGLRELPAFRADMRTVTGMNDGYTRRIIAARLRDVHPVEHGNPELMEVNLVHRRTAPVKLLDRFDLRRIVPGSG